MTTLYEFFQTLVDNVVLLLVIVPVLGAILVGVLGRFGAEGTRMIAMSNVGLSLSLAVLMASNFHLPDAVEFTPWQMVSSLRWIAVRPADDHSAEAREMTPGKPQPLNVHCEVGIDGIGLPFVLLIVAVMFAVVGNLSVDTPHLDRRVVGVLLAESALLLCVTARDAVLFGLANLLAVLCLYWLVVQAGSADRRRAARRFFLAQASSSLMLTGGVIGMAVAAWWMGLASNGGAHLTLSLPLVVETLPQLALATPAAHVFWETISPWLFLLLLAGCVLRVPLPPLHHWWYATAEEADGSATALVLAGWLPLGSLTVQRIMVPVFPALGGELAHRLLIWCAIAGVLIGLTCVVQRNVWRQLAGSIAVGSICAFGGCWTGSPAALTGSVLFLIGISGAGALVFLTLRTNCDGLLAVTPERSLLAVGQWPLLFGVFGLLAVPFSASFGGQWLLLQNWFSSTGTGKWFLLAILLTNWAIIESARCERFSSQAIRPLRATLCYTPLAVFLVIIGVAPQWIVAMQTGGPGSVR